MALILVVDDDEGLRAMMRGTLELDGHDVVEAEDGRRGVELLHDRDPDLIITDILMPTMEGLETIRDVRARRPELPIIAISGGGAMDGRDLLDFARTFGADAALSKPFRPVALRSAVSALLNGGRANRRGVRGE